LPKVEAALAIASPKSANFPAISRGTGSLMTASSATPLLIFQDF
jgi:hypothetical protein